MLRQVRMLVDSPRRDGLAGAAKHPYLVNKQQPCDNHGCQQREWIKEANAPLLEFESKDAILLVYCLCVMYHKFSLVHLAAALRTYT